MANMRYYRVTLRPLPDRIDSAGRRLPLKDDEWIIYSCDRNRLVIHNIRTSHVLNLPKDFIHDFRERHSPFFGDIKHGTLILLGRVWMSGTNAGLEPLSLPMAEKIQLKQFDTQFFLK